ncbi:CDK5 and ABL1 enzyme substrate 1 [Allomyces arbusculus]|nr:CDK5 and ABL1 enzyme substrate 1 [Allomyces arbusculus]
MPVATAVSTAANMARPTSVPVTPHALPAQPVPAPVSTSLPPRSPATSAAALAFLSGISLTASTARRAAKRHSSQVASAAPKHAAPASVASTSELSSAASSAVSVVGPSLPAPLDATVKLDQIAEAPAPTPTSAPTVSAPPHRITTPAPSLSPRHEAALSFLLHIPLHPAHPPPLPAPSIPWPRPDDDGFRIPDAHAPLRLVPALPALSTQSLPQSHHDDDASTSSSSNDSAPTPSSTAAASPAAIRAQYALAHAADQPKRSQWVLANGSPFGRSTLFPYRANDSNVTVTVTKHESRPALRHRGRASNAESYAHLLLPTGALCAPASPAASTRPAPQSAPVRDEWDDSDDEGDSPHTGWLARRPRSHSDAVEHSPCASPTRAPTSSHHLGDDDSVDLVSAGADLLHHHHPAAHTTGYDPNYLDDPALTTGRHKTVMALPGMLGSILQYTRPEDVKQDLNARFRATHPDVDPSLTLSQIRNLKRRLIKVGQICDLEISSVAKAFVYFEKLVLKRIVQKTNRRLIGAICLLLATKVNEPKGFKFGPLLDTLAKELGVSAKAIREHEFQTFAQLEFNLYLAPAEFIPHFERIFATLEYNDVQEYLGETQFFLAR